MEGVSGGHGRGEWMDGWMDSMYLPSGQLGPQRKVSDLTQHRGSFLQAPAILKEQW